jgi:hypothetical protein
MIEVPSPARRAVHSGSPPRSAAWPCWPPARPLRPSQPPRHTVYTIVHTFNGTYADLSIAPNGQIALIDPRSPMVKDYTFVSLESIVYRR